MIARLLRLPPVCLVALGTGCGAVVRVALVEGSATWVSSWTAIALINLVGSVAAGALWMHLAQGRAAGAARTPSLAWSALMVTGFLGGFTTFSGFGLDTAWLATTGSLDAAISNVWVGMITSILGAMLGVALARRTPTT